MFPLSVSTYVKISILVVLICGSFYGGWHSRDRDFTIYKDQVRIAAEKQIAENKAKEKEQALITKGVTDAYNANIANIHTFYSGMHNASSGSMSYDANATVNIDGKAFNVLLVAEQCANTTQQLQSLQDWVRSQVGLDQ
jgi:general stress protein CsbA